MDRIASAGQSNIVGVDNSSTILQVGSRKSQLALIQTQHVIDKLKDFYVNNPDRLKSIQQTHSSKWNNKFNIIPKSTTGDEILNKPLPQIGTKSLFTKELELALLKNEVSFVVHSLKDLPTTLPDGCCIGAVLRRDDPNDVIVLKKSLVESSINPLDLLFETGLGKFKIGTSSQRRIAMVKRCNQHIECIDIRGNLNTRISKLDNDQGEYSAIILAKAGLDRMRWSNRASGLLSPKEDSRLTNWHYAVGQGAIAVECRSSDQLIIDILNPIVDVDTTYQVIAERNLMKKLEGGCSVPLGVRSTLSKWDKGISLKLESIVLSIDGQEAITEATTRDMEFKTVVDKTQMHDKFEELTTGISLVQHCQNFAETAHCMIECSKLGISLADKMIERGCLKLMNRER